MKITYLHQYFNTPEMSGGTRSYEMARRLVAMGHEVNMVTSWREEGGRKDWFETEEAGITVHWLPVPYSNCMSFDERIRAFLKFALRSAQRVASLESDIVFATSTPLTIALPAVYAAHRQKVRMVFEVRDLWPEMPIAMGALKNPILRFLARHLEKWAYKNSAAIVALSPGMKSGVVHSGYSAAKVAVIPNSSDNSEFACSVEAGRKFRAARSWVGDRPLLVYTGTFGAVNGVSYMVDLAAALLGRGSDVRILLVGAGAERDMVQQAAKEAGVYNVNLFIEDPLPKNEMPALLSAATMASVLFVDLPEMRVNSANKFFDALASGTPVLLNYGGWMHDLVTSRGCGLAMWKRSITDVAKAIDSRVADQEWLVRSGQAARKLAEQCFDRDILAAQLVSVLQSTVDGCPQNAAEIAPGGYD